MRNKELFPESRSRRGDALIFLLIALILGTAIYGLQRYMKSHTLKQDPDTAQDLTPWKEWRLREKSEKPVPPISETQAKISKTIRFDTNVYLPGTNDPRGELTLYFSPQGIISGTWSGVYYNDKKDNFDVQPSHFDGRVFPGKIYRDKKGEDPSKLYFLSAGNFMIHKVSAETKEYRILGGAIYVRGWLNPDLSVTGEIIITGDETYSDTFSFKTARPEEHVLPKGLENTLK